MVTVFAFADLWFWGIINCLKKTTIASIVAKESNMDKSVHMHTDDFFHYLSKGAIPPHLPESNEQNLVVIEAFLEAAKRYARGGYDVIVDGIVGPWFLEPWRALVREDYEVHYIVLSCLRFFCFFVVYYPQTELKERAEHEKRLFKRKHHRVFKPKVR